jgi:hypothetical protein
MAGSVRVEIDEAAVAELTRDWTSPVGLYIERLTEEIEGAAKAMAPVSRKGSRYAPPGYLRGRIRTAHQFQPDGTIFGMVGIPLNQGSRYPLPFVSNPKGTTRNANKVNGQVRHYGSRAAANKFLLRALESVAGG